ncbi:MAG: 3'-5' exonuclease [Acidobacteriota bacterium]|jgi:DNA polymerase III epsilon subunit-like protein
MVDITYFCIDIEASGPVPGLFNMVSLGAVPVVRERGRWVPADEDLYLLFRPMNEGFDPEAMAIHGISREEMESRGEDPGAAMATLREWSLAHCVPPRARPVFVGHNAVFDWAFVNYYFVATREENPFGWKAIDTKTLAMGRLRLPWFDTHKERLQELLPGLGPQDQARVHRADYDAHYQAVILAELLNLDPPL